ncbi:MAG TPA: hypothetical protein VFJ85_05560 [Acidimicrobiales bacterium]|nr:hypothetical protein [Acidimicrobiales bacterium]
MVLLPSCRHPRPVELSAWFDGEGTPAVGLHVADCPRCQEALREWEDLRRRLRPGVRSSARR